MAHKRKDTLTKPPEWWRHLRPENKRRVAKAERRAARRKIEFDKTDSEKHSLEDSVTGELTPVRVDEEPLS